MILAAGLGTRLRPLTDRLPKALVEVDGVPMLERVARRLVAAGVRRLVVNVHHRAEQVERFVAERNGFGVEVAISWEEGESPLETGGGLLAAAPLFEKRAPFFLHNVDVISQVDLGAMYEAHRQAEDLATLAVQDRETSRPLLVDGEGVYGVANRRSGWRQVARAPRGREREVAFAGIHVVSPALFELAHERGRFPIWDPYFRLVREGHRLAAFDIGEARWLEVGTPERLERARSVLRAERASA